MVVGVGDDESIRTGQSSDGGDVSQITAGEGHTRREPQPFGQSSFQSVMDVCGSGDESRCAGRGAAAFDLLDRCGTHQRMRRESEVVVRGEVESVEHEVTAVQTGSTSALGRGEKAGEEGVHDATSNSHPSPCAAAAATIAAVMVSTTSGDEI